MLISDKYGFIIATPVKTGTTTLLGMAQTWVKQGGSPKVLRAFSGDPVTKHRMAPPDGAEEYDRFMTVRDPASRLPSMYEWMRKWPHPAAIHNVIVDAETRKGERKYGWREFLRALAVTREAGGYYAGGKRRKGTKQPYMWTDTQSEHFDYLQGRDTDGALLPWFREDEPGILNTESLMEDWHALLTDYEVAEHELYDLKVPHLNKSRDRLADNPGIYWDLLGGAEQRVFLNLSMADCDSFGWDIMGPLK